MSYPGRYEPLLQLGRGGMGTALLARVTGSGGFERLVVVKRSHARLLDDSNSRRRLFEEARLAAYVHHANVVGVQQVEVDDEGPFLVLDYIEGLSLAQLVARADERETQIPVPIVTRITLDCLAGLHAIHEARDVEGRPVEILHRDVSPQNVLVGTDGVSRIADFGIARSAVSSPTTDQNEIVGKLLYMAPEYLARDCVDRRVDVYGMGLTLWHTLAGRSPWPSATDAQLMAHIFTSRIPALSEVRPVPSEIEAAIMKACARRPDDRHATADDMARVIEAAGHEEHCIATHSEVARFVAEIGGVIIERRRADVAQFIGASKREVAEQVTRRHCLVKAGSETHAGTSWHWWVGGAALGIGLVVSIVVTRVGGPSIVGAGAVRAAPTASSHRALLFAAPKSVDSGVTLASELPPELPDRAGKRHDSASAEYGPHTTRTEVVHRTRAKSEEHVPRRGTKVRATISRERDTISKKNPYR